MPTKHDVIALHRKHPDWSMNRVAIELNCMPEYVRATARRNKLKFRSSEIFKLGRLVCSLGLSENDLRKMAARKEASHAR